MTGTEPQRSAPPLPLYQRIKTHIAEHIRRGIWPAGLKIPSENQLVSELKVSRMTINRALRELTDEGFLSRVQGVGTFVRGNPAPAGTVAMFDVAEDIHARDRVHSIIIEDKGVVRANPELARSFALSEPAKLFHVTAVHCEDELPVQVEEVWCHMHFAPDFLDQDFATLSPAAYLAGLNPTDDVEHVIRPLLPPARYQRLLIIHQDEPCLTIERRSWTQGAVWSYVRLTHPGSRFTWRARPTPPLPMNRD